MESKSKTFRYFLYSRDQHKMRVEIEKGIGTKWIDE